MSATVVGARLKVNFSGTFYKIVDYGLDATTELLDYAELERLAIEHKIDRTSLFECRGRVPDKSTVKRRFRGSGVTPELHSTAVFAWRALHAPAPISRGFAPQANSLVTSISQTCSTLIVACARSWR